MINDNKLNKIVDNINRFGEEIKLDNINIMEVCGTHTHSIAKYGIKSILSNKINLISGPGCPVCVTHQSYIDAAIDLSRKGVIIATFGDLMRVNGNQGNLLEEKSKGRDIRVVYSVYDVVNIAEKNKEKQVVFLGVGFETTAPIIAAVIKEAHNRKIKNLYFLTSIKIMPPILDKILTLKTKNIDGIICPGNVAVIKGAESFKFIYEKYGVPAVVCGFEPEDILGGIYFLIKEIKRKQEGKRQRGFENLYRRCVSDLGNKMAIELIEEIFKIDNVLWRGIGNVNNSALVIKDKYSELDAVKKFNLYRYFNDKEEVLREDNGCKCSEVLIGNISPKECGLFGKVCTPRTPCGPCMVSSEGACAAYYKYI
ncbi:hydrogenase formation protein HypD [Clostridium ganghwense]|uniref:Hydrogenase formation protein HypD n=1 Tax=Clostridium ganghwense TaxID=312089 RepID=A0ABT4CSH9_9CLOT|nr:hydrogenase formation protein HypD [Clostridium ganghwense]MCY6372030.1 hydrogenase formation protein HypD [Clostridium ganghwense]